MPEGERTKKPLSRRQAPQDRPAPPMLLRPTIRLSLLATASAHAAPSFATGRLLRSGTSCRFQANAAAAAAATCPVQRVVDHARAGDLDATARAMEGLDADALGLSTEGLRDRGPIGYHHVYADRQVSVGIFVLPAGSSIPLHDHPGMSVLSKLLFGSLRVISSDRPPPAAAPSTRSRGFSFGGLSAAAELRCAPPIERTVAAPCATLRLDPLEGNVHCFEALEHTAVFDVLTPPYDDAAGRSCHYYEPADVAADGGEWLLREIGWPPGLRVVTRSYTGPVPS